LRASTNSDFAGLFVSDGVIEGNFGFIPKQPHKAKCAYAASDLHDL